MTKYGRVFLLITAFGMIMSSWLAILPASAQQETASLHPRLWIRADDLPRLRAWATDDNPFYSEGLALLAENAKAEMDAGNVPNMDSGDITWEQYPTEMYAQLFAFMSLIENDPAVRDDYAQRARTVLMSLINVAAQGASPGTPFRDPDFSTYDRSRWWGEGFALTVDWIYPYLTNEDKKLIRTVFLRWSEENMNAEVTSFNHPEPTGVYNDPALLSDDFALRWSANNYYLSHMRNIGLMALALDSADDPDGRLQEYLRSATGAWLYRIDNLLRTQQLAGFSPEGWQYGPESLGSLAQFLLALETSGQNNPDLWGDQVVWDNNSFWNDVIPAYVHSLSPATATPPTWDWIAPVYLPAWYGDGQEYWAPDAIGLFGPLGIHAYNTGNTTLLNGARWIQANTPPGGEESLLFRVGDVEVFRDAILYFLLFDPAAPPPTDPRDALPLRFYSPGLGRILARTSWETDASWFTFHLGWLSIDHQLAEGGQFEFYRNGEWLTSARVGWDGTIEPYGCNIGRSDYHNTLALQNDQPALDSDSDSYLCYVYGSQWIYAASGDGNILAQSFGDDFVYALGDMTALYNSTELEVNDILHASRSIIWLEPDYIVVYDRARSQDAGRFKRFWLNTPTLANINGNQAVVTTEQGQQLIITALLPLNTVIVSEQAEPLEDEVAVDQPMHYRVMMEDPEAPAEVRFLHVLQGADSGAEITTTTLVESTGSTAFSGAVVGDAVVLFPVDLSVSFTELRYEAPASVIRHIITGLQPNSSYDVSVQNVNDTLSVSVQAGSAYKSDEGGVLIISQ